MTSARRWSEGGCILMNALIVRAVIVRDDQLLVARMLRADYVFLPGGHVEDREYLDEALARELKEELGLRCERCEYLGFVEHRWRDSDTEAHEVNHCFSASVEIGGGALAPRSRESHLTFEWIPIRTLAAHNLQPFALASLIAGYFAGDRRTWAVSRS